MAEPPHHRVEAVGEPVRDKAGNQARAPAGVRAKAEAAVRAAEGSHRLILGFSDNML